jgi:hypothetical protein
MKKTRSKKSRDTVPLMSSLQSHTVCIYCTLGRGGGGGQREGTVEGQQYTSIVPLSMGATVHKLGRKDKP